MNEAGKVGYGDGVQENDGGPDPANDSNGHDWGKVETTGR